MIETTSFLARPRAELPERSHGVEERAAGSMATGSALVAHPTLQHSHQLALALHESKLLQAFWSGVPVASPDEPLPIWMPERFRRKVKRVDIPASMRLHPMRFQLALRAGQLALPESGTGLGDLPHRIFHWFDAWTAQRIRRLKPKLVVAYENSAYHTFAAAKAVGARCVLDAASLHHRTSFDLMNGHRRSAFDVEVNRRKDAETEMADVILTCSPLAADSYLSHGVPASKVHPLLLGAELPARLLQRRPERGGPPRFIFAGVLSRRKSVDLILSAFKRLADEGLAYEVEFVGNANDTALLDQVRATPGASHRPGVAQSDLYPLMAAADCLLLPSRFDSFGMVVAEAMACGTPALVSTQTGAKAIIEETPGSGWIVEPDGDALHAQLRQLILEPALLENAREHAQRAAESYTWQAYRRRATRLLSEALC
jgi:glycosyltransferase involved in cell wall biosynthesis